MKWLITIICVFLIQMTVLAEEPEELYAQSAVLMDAESGRVLFEKNGYEQKAMASTTKIMTCILALEYGNLEDEVVFSEVADKQPEVHLGAPEGSRFYLKDLLYSLMLESHNDSAVAIAEHIGGTVEGFAELMNEKAMELGCKSTHYVTPNGLDESDEGGNHVTTAEDLAKVMSYCIMESPKAKEFLEITQTPNYSFTELEKNTTYSCVNHNAFLNMMEGAISGKTGYTSKAGYCYVGAMEKDGRTFVVALLACGWPNHKEYKWEDTKELMEYALDNYEYRNIFEQEELADVLVEDGIPKNENMYADAYTKIYVDAKSDETCNVLLGKNEEVQKIVRYEKELEAPIKKGEQIGSITYYLGEKFIVEYPILTAENIKEKDMAWYFVILLERYIKMA